VAKIDPRLFQATLENARANYAQAKATLDKDRVLAKFADRQFKRAGPAGERQTDCQFLTWTLPSPMPARPRPRSRPTKANVKQPWQFLHLAEVNLALTDIVSPTDGTVISRNVDVGQTVAASLQAPVLFVIAEDLRKMQVDTSVAEADVGKLARGHASHIHRGRLSGRAVQRCGSPNSQRRHDGAERGHLRRRHRRGQLRSQARPGMTANISFVFRQQGRRAARDQRSPSLSSQSRSGQRAQAGNAHGRRSGSDGASGGPPAGAAGQRVRAAWRRATSHLIDARSGCCAMICPARFASRPAPATAARPRWWTAPCSPGFWSLAMRLSAGGFQTGRHGTGMLPGAGPPPGGPRRF